MWANTPDDQRFGNIDALIADVKDRHQNSFEREGIIFPDVQEVTHQDDDPVLVTQDGERFRFSNHGFVKLCRTLGASAETMAKLPAENVAQDLTYLLQNRDANMAQMQDLEAREKAEATWAKPRKILALNTAAGQLPMIRHIGSERYGRIYDLDVALWAKGIMTDHGFTVPPSKYKENSGLYAGDESVFIMLQDLSKSIEVKRPGGGMEQLTRGIMVWNSEVGEKTFGFMGFLCQMICDNHIVWGAENVIKTETRHVGNAFERAADQLLPQVTAYLEKDTREETDLIFSAMNNRIAAKPDEALTFLRGKGFTKKVAQEALVRARIDPDNEGLEPLSFLAVVNGLTSQARDMSGAMERTDLERRARGILELVAA